MDPFHEQVARVGLDAIGRFGFVLAGGYAVQLHGLRRRPSDDVDLFTDEPDPVKFSEAVRRAVAAWEAEGMSVTVVKQAGTFARFYVASGHTEMKVEMSHDWRADPPVILDVGPVLSRDDAVANKMTAAFGRYFARDFIDVYSALTDGGYSRERLVELAREHDGGFDRRYFALAIRNGLQLSDMEYEMYGVSGDELAGLRATLSSWADELEES